MSVSWPGSNTSLQPGVCLIHGYHGFASCPACSTSAIPGQRIDGARPVPPTGWLCPRCQLIHAPSVLYCARCAIETNAEGTP